jgi:hypothetical protein
LTTVALVAFGAAASFYTVQRAAALEAASSRSFPSFVAAYDIRTALAKTDLLAAQTFLTGGVERLDLQLSYQAELSGAINKVTTYAGASNDPKDTEIVAAITGKIAVYSALVGQARAYRRDGVPLGAAYLRRASTIMQRDVIPDAEQLIVRSSDRLAGDYRQATRAYQALTVCVLGGVLLATLLVAQVLVALWNKRVLNIGMALATVAMLLATGYLGWAWSAERARLREARDQGFTPMSLLSQSRSLALRARSDEVLYLIARGSGAVLQADFDQVVRELGYESNGTRRPDGSLVDLGSSASANGGRSVESEVGELVRSYIETHKNIQRLDNDGDFNAAVDFTLDLDPTKSGGAFMQVDTALDRHATDARARFESAVSDAEWELRSTLVVVPPLVLAAIILCFYGHHRRIREYQ